MIEKNWGVTTPLAFSRKSKIHIGTDSHIQSSSYSNIMDKMVELQEMIPYIEIHMTCLQFVDQRFLKQPISNFP